MNSKKYRLQTWKLLSIRTKLLIDWEKNYCDAIKYSFTLKKKNLHSSMEIIGDVGLFDYFISLTTHPELFTDKKSWWLFATNFKKREVWEQNNNKKFGNNKPNLALVTFNLQFTDLFISLSNFF